MSEPRVIFRFKDEFDKYLNEVYFKSDEFKEMVRKAATKVLEVDKETKVRRKDYQTFFDYKKHEITITDKNLNIISTITYKDPDDPFLDDMVERAIADHERYERERWQQN